MSGAWRKVLWLLLGVAAAAVVAVLASAQLLTEWWWFQELGQDGIFWRLYAWPWGVRIVASVLFALVIFINLRLTQPAIARALFRFQDRMPEFLSWRVVKRIMAAVALVFGVMASEVLAANWHIVASFIHRTPFGIADPLFNKDVGFYVFEVAFYRLLHNGLTGVLVLSGLFVLGVYAFTGALQWRDNRFSATTGTGRHLLGLLAAGVLLKAADYWLGLFELPFSDRSSAIFGATYTDWHARAFGLRVLLVLAVLLAAVLAVNMFQNRRQWIAISAGTWLAGAVLLGGVYPGLLQRFIVEPNELERERPFIEHHLRFTRIAYGLNAIEEEDFDVDNALTWEDLQTNSELVDNARLWDWRPLQRTYGQLQSIRFYYTFPDVDVDRYTINGQLRQVMLAPRELDLRQVPNPTWVNQHLQYTHGYGLAMSPVNEVTAQGLPTFFLADIPPRPRNVDLTVERPEIYYGEMTNHYVIVGTRTPDFEFSYPSGEDNVRTTYGGTGGVPMGSLFRRAAFAVRTGTINLLLSDEIAPDTRILFRRNIIERVSHLAPFLRFDADPYAVLAEGRLYWIIDGYTTSADFPYSMPNRAWRANYVRNSVKAVVDAYNGTVDFYIFDDEDPLIATYDKMFPGLLRPGAEMPEALRRHVRYPEDFFRLQAEMFSMYHMRNPTIFYNREDVWRFAREVYTGGDSARTREQVMDPYYVIVRLPDRDEPEMVLMLPFTPSERNNMIAWLAARMDGDNYGRLLAYRFPKDELVYGPMQIEARIDQHPDISQLLTLWAQLGSNVIRGNMLVLPIERSLLYLKPIYLQAETGDLPELVRVIAAFGDEIAMHPTLEQVLRAVVRGDTAAVDVAPPDALASQFRLQPESSTLDIVPPEAEDGGVPSTEEGPPSESAEWQDLARQALDLYESALERLQDGDWAGYGDALEQLEAVLERLARHER